MLSVTPWFISSTACPIILRLLFVPALFQTQYYNTDAYQGTDHIVENIIKLTQPASRNQLQNLNSHTQPGCSEYPFPVPKTTGQHTSGNEHNHICYDLAPLYIPCSPRPEEFELYVFSSKWLPNQNRFCKDEECIP